MMLTQTRIHSLNIVGHLENYKQNIVITDKMQRRIREMTSHYIGCTILIKIEALDFWKYSSSVQIL